MILIVQQMFSLEQLEARSIPVNEQYMPVLSRALRITPHLQVLKLKDCALSGRPIIILGKSNSFFFRTGSLI